MKLIVVVADSSLSTTFIELTDSPLIVVAKEKEKMFMFNFDHTFPLIQMAEPGDVFRLKVIVQGRLFI
jgi:hypothetical protein